MVWFVVFFFSQQLCFSASETQRLKKLFLPFHCPKAGADSIEALRDLRADQLARCGVCDGAERRGERPAVPYPFTPCESKSLTQKLSWVRGTWSIRRENHILVTHTWEILPNPERFQGGW